MAQNIIDAITASLNDSAAEISGEIDALRQQIADGVPSQELDFTALAAAAKKLADIVPDNTDDDLDPDFGVNHPE